jgi:hypothetical protein
LFINKDKFLALGFHHNSNKHVAFPDIILKDRQITYVSETTFLGVWLDHNLNWHFNVVDLIIKSSKLCFALKTIKSFIKKISKPCIFAYFHSSLKYGSLIWGNSYEL